MNVDPTGHAWWEWAVAAVVVVACVAGAVVTGGTSLAGAAMIGAAIGGAVSIGSQAVEAVQSGSDDFNLGQFAVDVGVGAVSGALGATGVSRAISTVANATIGATSSLASQLAAGEDVSWTKVGIGAMIGGVQEPLAVRESVTRKSCIKTIL